MATLYEILGLNKNATAEQIEQGFVTQSDLVTNTEPDADKRRMRQKVIREAYDILSSDTRRQAYDHKQQFGSVRPNYEVVESSGMPWLKILLVVALLLGINLLYQYKSANEAKREALIQEAKLAKVEAQRAARDAEAEQARLAQAVLNGKQEAESRRMREMEQARREGRDIHYRLAQEAERERYVAQAEKEREQNRRRQLEYDKQREEQNAKRRIAEQEEAMRRALAIRVRTPD
jgi:curved DNA-binding protein CbpA